MAQMVLLDGQGGSTIHIPTKQALEEAYARKAVELEQRTIECRWLMQELHKSRWMRRSFVFAIGMSLFIGVCGGSVLRDMAVNRTWLTGAAQETAKPVYAIMAERVDARVWRAENAVTTETFHKGQLVRVWYDLWAAEPPDEHWYVVSRVDMKDGRIETSKALPTFDGGQTWVRAEHLTFMPLCSP